MKKNFVLAAVAATGLGFAGIQAHAQMDGGISEAMCRSHMVIVQQAIYLRQQQVPIQIALDVADSSFDTNTDLYNFLRGSIRAAYEDPTTVQQAIDNGRALEICIKQVRGF